MNLNISQIQNNIVYQRKTHIFTIHFYAGHLLTFKSVNTESCIT